MKGARSQAFCADYVVQSVKPYVAFFFLVAAKLRFSSWSWTTKLRAVQKGAGRGTPREPLRPFSALLRPSSGLPSPFSSRQPRGAVALSEFRRPAKLGQFRENVGFGRPSPGGGRAAAPSATRPQRPPEKVPGLRACSGGCRP